MTSHLAFPTGSCWLESLILRAYPSPTYHSPYASDTQNVNTYDLRGFTDSSLIPSKPAPGPATPRSPAESRRRPTYRRSSPDSPAKSRPRRSRRRPAVIPVRAGHADDQQGPPRTKVKANEEDSRQSNTSLLSPFPSGSSHHIGVVPYVYYSA